MLVYISWWNHRNAMLVEDELLEQRQAVLVRKLAQLEQEELCVLLSHNWKELGNFFFFSPTFTYVEVV